MLKWIAVITMLIDHIAFFFFDQIPPTLYECMRGIGRLAMPIFAFSLALGVERSKNWLKYFSRLVLTAVISEFAIRKIYALNYFYRTGINIIFTFACSLVFIIALKVLIRSGYDVLVRMQPIQSTGMQNDDLPYQFRLNLGGVELPPLIGLLLGVAFMIISVFGIIYYDMEYGIYGLGIVLAFSIAMSVREEKQFFWAMLLIILANLISHVLSLTVLKNVMYYNSLQWITVLAVPICLQHKDEKKPAKWEQYFFYVFYPLHLLILGIIRYLVLK